MLRCGQMMLAQTLLTKHLGRGKHEMTVCVCVWNSCVVRWCDRLTVTVCVCVWNSCVVRLV